MRTPLLFALVLAIAAPVSAEIVLSTPRDRKVGVDASDLTLGWRPEDPNEQGTTYTVEMSTSSDFTSLVPLEKPAVKYDRNESRSLSYKVAVADDGKLTPGTRYYWRVLRECESCQPTRSNHREFTVARDLFGDAPITLTQTVTGDDAAEPAKFKFLRTPDEESGENENTYSADFALQYAATQRGSFTPIAYLESVLNSSDDTDTAIRLAGGVEHVLSQSVNTYMLKLEGDQDLDTRKLMAEGTFALVGGIFGRGIDFNENRYTFEPTIITAFGRTLERGDSEETDESVLRAGLNLALRVDLYPLARRLNVPVALTLTDTAYYLPNEEEERKNLLTAALDLEVASGFTVGIAYKHGAEAPDFKGTHSIGLTLGLKVVQP